MGFHTNAMGFVYIAIGFHGIAMGFDGADCDGMRWTGLDYGIITNSPMALPVECLCCARALP